MAKTIKQFLEEGSQKWGPDKYKSQADGNKLSAHAFKKAADARKHDKRPEAQLASKRDMESHHTMMGHYHKGHAKAIEAAGKSSIADKVKHAYHKTMSKIHYKKSGLRGKLMGLTKEENDLLLGEQQMLSEIAKAKKAKKPKKAKYQYYQGKRKPASWCYTQECPHCNNYYEVHDHTKNENRCPECGENVNDENHKRCDCPHKEQVDEAVKMRGSLIKYKGEEIGRVQKLRKKQGAWNGCIATHADGTRFYEPDGKDAASTIASAASKLAKYHDSKAKLKEQVDEGLSNPMPSSYELRDLHLKNAAYYHKLADKHEKKTKKANSYHRDTAKYHEDEAKKLDRKR